ncbi:MAG: hypothetical protein U0768_13170 [Anaerolineae bacterium]
MREDGALINRMGFNNGGIETMAHNLVLTKRRVPIGVNIGKNKTTPPEPAAADYLDWFHHPRPGRLHRRQRLLAQHPRLARPSKRGRRPGELLAPLREARDADCQVRGGRHVLTSSSSLPDEHARALDAALQVILDVGVDGIIATNTTTERAAGLRSARQNEQGGLSGRPLFERSTAVLRHLYRALGGRLPIIGVGGVDGPESAYAKILAGARPRPALHRPDLRRPHPGQRDLARPRFNRRSATASALSVTLSARKRARDPPLPHRLRAGFVT